jgi:hypothetical protein
VLTLPPQLPAQPTGVEGVALDESRLLGMAAAPRRNHIPRRSIRPDTIYWFVSVGEVRLVVGWSWEPASFMASFITRFTSIQTCRLCSLP